MALKQPLSKELQMIAESELNEVPSRVESDIAHIREWLNQQSYIKARTDDSTLLIFLRACKFSLEKTKMRLEVFYTVKTEFADVFKNRDPFLPEFEYVFQNNNIVILPSRLNGPILALGKFDYPNTDIISLVDILTINTMVADVLLREYPNTSVVGIIALLDLSVIPFNYFSQITPTFIKKLITCFINCYPVRIKGIYFINAPSAFVTIFNIGAALLPKKLQNKILCFSSNGDETVRHFFSRENFPSEYGGNAGSLSDLSDQLKEKFISYYDWFVEDEQFGCNKHEKPKYFLQNTDLFGSDGSFRKLEID